MKQLEAIKSLDDKAQFSIREGVVTWVTEPISDELIAEEMARLKVIYDNAAYARARKIEYDQLCQFELMFNDKRDGTSTWMDAVNKIKSDIPKTGA